MPPRRGPAGTWAKPPDWFKTKDYSYLKRLDDRGWLHELQRCRARWDRVDLSEWESIGEPGWTKGYIPAHIGPPAVHVVEKADQSTMHNLEKPALIVQVWLGAPDHVIIECFKEELKSARRTTPAPVRTRGSKTAPALIREMHFAGWIAHRIVQLCDLQTWRYGLTAENTPKDADMGRWLFP
jgi:hypothetical protein